VKLTKYPDGRIEFDDCTVEDAMRIAGLNGTAPKKSKESKKRGRPRETTDVADLNESQLQTWQYLTARDTEEGITAADYASDSGLTQTVADSRLRKLTELGMARKVTPGRFRAGLE
jgi:ribosomal protein S25